MLDISVLNDGLPADLHAVKRETHGMFDEGLPCENVGFNEELCGEPYNSMKV